MIQKGLMILTVGLLGACQTSQVATIQCSADIPVCVCNPDAPQCRDREVEQPNVFTDRGRVQLEVSSRRADLPELDPERLRRLYTKLQTDIRNQGGRDYMEFHVKCSGDLCGRYPGVQVDLRELLGAEPTLDYQGDAELASLRVDYNIAREALRLKAYRVDGQMNTTMVSTQQIVLEQQKAQRWAKVKIPIASSDSEADSEAGKFMQYRVLREMVSKKEYASLRNLPGPTEQEKDFPMEGLFYEEAARYCANDPDNVKATLPSVHVLEHTVRNGLIVGSLYTPREMVRLTNPMAANESLLIREDVDLFAFDRHAEQMLIFNWSDGSYSTAKQSYRQDKIGFRCAVLEEVASVEVEGLDLDALLEGDDLEENLEKLLENDN
jgi:hypothetical protein